MQKYKEGLPLPRSQWWKVFFFTFLIIKLSSFNTSIENIILGNDVIFNLLNIMIYSFVLIAIWGYSFNKKIFNRKLWKFIVPIILIFDILETYSFPPEFDKYSITIIILALIIAIPLIIFQYIALYKYSYSKIEPWKNNTEKIMADNHPQNNSELQKRPLFQRILLVTPVLIAWIILTIIAEMLIFPGIVQIINLAIVVFTAPKFWIKTEYIKVPIQTQDPTDSKPQHRLSA